MNHNNLNHTPLFPCLRASLGPMRSASASAALRPLKQATLSQIEARLAPALGPDVLKKPASKDHCRERIHTLARVFWCFIWQMLQSCCSCREVVRQVQALFEINGWGRVDEDCAAYCRARARLPMAVLEKALACTSAKAGASCPKGALLQGRRLKAVDGTSLRAADTPANRKAFPPTKTQSAKPTFPLVKVVVLFAMESGAILARAVGTLLQSELRLLISLAAELSPGDILVGDRHFGCFLVASWLRSLQADLVSRVATRSRKVDFRRAKKRLGPGEALFAWRRPAARSPLLSKEEWALLPEEITVRMIRTSIVKRGHRTEWITLVTTLLDEKAHPAAEIVQAYARRWRLEMTLDDLKTTMGMRQLRGHSPAVVEREVMAFLVAHNFLRWVMAQAARHGRVDVERVSFKGTMDALRQWCVAMTQVGGPAAEKRKALAELWDGLLRTLAADLVPLRPGREEPRAVKTPRKYPALNRSRRQYRGRPSRGARRRASRAKANSEMETHA